MVGQTFVLTGTLTRPRKEIVNILKARGDHVASSVSNNTNYVVAGNDVLGTTKLRKAEMLRVPIITEAQMWRMVGGSPGGSANIGRRLPMRIYGRASTRKSPTRRASRSPTKRSSSASKKSPTKKRRHTTSPYKRRSTLRPFVRLARSKNVTKLPARLAPYVTI